MLHNVIKPKSFLESSKPSMGVPQHLRGQPVQIIVHNKIPESNPSSLSVRLHVHDPVGMLRQSISQQLQIPPG